MRLVQHWQFETKTSVQKSTKGQPLEELNCSSTWTKCVSDCGVLERLKWKFWSRCLGEWPRVGATYVVLGVIWSFASFVRRVSGAKVRIRVGIVNLPLCFIHSRCAKSLARCSTRRSLCSNASRISNWFRHNFLQCLKNSIVSVVMLLIWCFVLCPWFYSPRQIISDEAHSLYSWIDTCSVSNALSVNTTQVSCLVSVSKVWRFALHDCWKPMSNTHLVTEQGKTVVWIVPPGLKVTALNMHRTVVG